MYKDIFVYGSLLNIESASQVVGPISAEHYRLACVPNAFLEFDVPYLVKVDGWQGEADFLNFHLGNNGVSNRVYGMVLRVSKDNFDRLIVREKKYSAIEVKLSDGKHAFVFSSLHPNGGRNVILNAYIEKILSGARTFGESFYELIYTQTLSCLCNRKILEGRYHFLDGEVNRLTNV